MINKLRLRFFEVCHLLDECDHDFVQSPDIPIAYTEVKLMPYADKAFDGASRVDIVVRLSPNLGVPFEVKLGATRLSKSRIDKEWLSDCGVSHKNKRHTGNMMAILERRFKDPSARDSLRVQIGGQDIRLTDYWFIITRRNILNSWKGTGRPSFSPNVHLCSLEDIVEKLGGREPFNNMVQELLSFDYYSEWILDNEDEKSIDQHACD